MLPVLFTLLAFVAKVQAEGFMDPVQVNFVLSQSDQGRDYVWRDDTKYTEGLRRLRPAQGTDLDAIAGYLSFLGPDNKRTFVFKTLKTTVTENESRSTCEVWVESQPTNTVLTYEVGIEGKEGAFAGLSDDTDKLVVRCYNDPEYVPPSVYAPSRHSDIPPSNPATRKSFNDPLTVTFYGSPDNLLSPAWWLDGTDYKSQKFDVSEAMPSKPANHTDGSVGLGWMNFTSTSTDNRVYGWQSKSSDTETNITSCDFGITADLRVSKISYWVDSPRIEARRDGVQIEDWKSEGLREDIINDCRKV